MQQDFETTFNEFLTQTKKHFIEHEKFVESVVESLATLQHTNNEIPAAPKSVQEVPRKVTPLKITESKLILIVDSTEINRLLMGRYFKNMPVALEFANSGDQAIQKTSEQTFDLIIMEIQLKGMSGLEAIKEIRKAQPQNSNKTKIVAITNEVSNEEERAQAMSAGANEYLSKSMTREVIKEKVFELVH